MNIVSKGICIILGSMMLKGSAGPPKPILFNLRAGLADRDLKEKSVHDLHSAEQRAAYKTYIADRLVIKRDILKRLKDCPAGELLPRVPLGNMTYEHRFPASDKDLLKRIAKAIDPEYAQYLNYLNLGDMEELREEDEWNVPIDNIAEAAIEKIDQKTSKPISAMAIKVNDLKQQGFLLEAQNLKEFWEKLETFYTLANYSEIYIEDCYIKAEDRLKFAIGSNQELTDINMQIISILLVRARAVFKDLKEFYHGLDQNSTFKKKLDAVFVGTDSFSARLEDTEKRLKNFKMIDPARYNLGESNDQKKVLANKAIDWIEDTFNKGAWVRTRASNAIAWATDADQLNLNLGGDWVVYKLVIKSSY